MHFQYSGQTLHHSALRGCSTSPRPRRDIPLPPGVPNHLVCFQVRPRPWAPAQAPPPSAGLCAPRGSGGNKGPGQPPHGAPGPTQRLGPLPHFTNQQPRLREVGWPGQGHTASPLGQGYTPMSPGGVAPSSPRKVAELGCLSCSPNPSFPPLLEVCLLWL